MIILLLLLEIENSMASEILIEDISIQNESDPVSLNEAGVDLYNLGKYNESIEAYDEALLIDSSYKVAWCNKGLALNVLGRYNDSLLAYNEAIEIDSKYAAAWNGKGRVFSNLDRYNESIEAYDEALNTSPEYAVAWYNKGVSLEKLGRYNDSIQAYDKAIKINQNFADAWFNKGNILYKQKKYNESINAYDETLHIDSKYADAWDGKGLAYYKSHKYNESINAYNEAIKINPDYIKALNNKGVTLYVIGNYSDSIDAYDEAINIDPKYENAWYNKGLAFYELAKYNESKWAFDNAIRINKTSINAWNGKGNSLQKLNRTPEAAIAYARAKDLDPNNRKDAISISFLVVYIMILIVGCYFSKKCVISTEVIIFAMNLLGFLSYCWILSGLYDFKSVELFLLYGFLASAVTIILWASLGVPLDNLWLRLVDSFSVSRQKSCISPQIEKSICFIAIITYAAISSAFYLRSVESEGGTLYLLKSAFVLIFLVDLAITLPSIIIKLMSIYIDHDTRNLFLILQFGYLSINALLISVILWVFGVSREVLDVSSLFQLIIILLLVLTFLFPYLSGWQREKKWRELLLTTRHAWIEELLDICEFPTPSLYPSRLKTFFDKIKDYKDNFERDALIKNNKKYIRDIKTKSCRNIYDVAIRRNDPCTSHQDFLNKFQENLQEFSTQIETLKADQAEITKLGGTYANLYRTRKDEIAKMIETERNSKPLLWIGLTSFLTTILAALLTQIGAWLVPNIIRLSPLSSGT